MHCGRGASNEYPATLSKFDLFFGDIDIFFCRTRHSNNGGHYSTSTNLKDTQGLGTMPLAASLLVHCNYLCPPARHFG